MMQSEFKGLNITRPSEEIETNLSENNNFIGKTQVSSGKKSSDDDMDTYHEKPPGKKEEFLETLQSQYKTPKLCIPPAFIHHKIRDKDGVEYF